MEENRLHLEDPGDGTAVQQRARSIWTRSAFGLLALAAIVAIAAVWMRASRAHKTTRAGGETTAETTEPGIVKLERQAQLSAGLTFEVVQMKNAFQTVEATGIVGPNEARVAHVRPLARGRVERVYVRVGDRVRAGQPLVAYDNIELGELISQYVSGLAALQKNNAESEVTRRSVERAQKLIELGAVARAEYERRDAEYKSALASIEMQKAEIARVEEKIHRFGLTDADLARLDKHSHAQPHREASHSILRSPFGGVVIKSEVAEGEVVDTEREMFTVADISTVWVQADVYEKDIGAIRKGTRATILVDSYPGEEFGGKITYVSDFLDPKTRTAKVRCEVPNSQGRLKLEMFAKIQIPTSSSRETLAIPAAAIQQVEDKPVVFVKLSETEFEKREVQTGAQSSGWIEVKSGLKPGEVVAVQGSFYLKSALLRDQISGED